MNQPWGGPDNTPEADLPTGAGTGQPRQPGGPAPAGPGQPVGCPGPAGPELPGEQPTPGANWPPPSGQNPGPVGARQPDGDERAPGAPPPSPYPVADAATGPTHARDNKLPKPPSEPGPPEELAAARTLWLVAALLALLASIGSALTTRLSDLPEATRQTLRETAGPSVDDAMMDTLFAGAMVFSVVVSVVVCGLTIWLAGRMCAGRRWARILLDIRGVYLALSAGLLVIGLMGGGAEMGGSNEVASFVVAALQILAGLCGGVAVWRQHSDVANEYIAAGESGASWPRG